MTDDELAAAARALVRLVYQTFGAPLSPKWGPAVARVEAALDETAAAIEARVRTQVAAELRAYALNYPADVFPPDSSSRDGIAGTAMRHAYNNAAAIAERAEPTGTPKEPQP